MKKVITVLLMAVLLFGITAPSTFAASSVTWKKTVTVPYGKQTIVHEFNKAALVGYTPLKTIVQATVSEKGITFNSITQSSSYYWPYTVANKGTKIQTKSSANSKQQAHAYGKYYVKWMKVPKLNLQASSTYWELSTYARVISIDKKKKRVTIEVITTNDNTF